MFRPPAALTVDTAASVLESGMRAVAGGQVEIDLGELSAFDSAAVSSMLAWQRAAQAKGHTLHFVNVPANLRGLIELYGVNGLLAVSS